MVLNIRSQFTAIFNSTDTSGKPVINDVVRATVQHSNSSYFDGYTYSAEPTTLILKNLNNGNYELSLNFKKIGPYTIKIWSSANISLFKEINAEVVSDEDTVRKKVLIGQLISFDLKRNGADTDATLVVQNLETNGYVGEDGTAKEEYTEITMTDNGDGIFHHEMAMEQGTYDAIMSSQSKTSSFTVVVSDVAGPELVDIDHTTVRDPSGDPSITVDSKFSPMPGVKVQALDPKTISVKGSAITTNDGTWMMSIPRGTYLFKFSKEGFNSTLFEGTVV